MEVRPVPLEPDVQAKWYDTVGDLPSAQGRLEQGQARTDQHLKIFRQQLDDAKPAAGAPEVGTGRLGRSTTEMEKVHDGRQSAEQAAKEHAAEGGVDREPDDRPRSRSRQGGAGRAGVAAGVRRRLTGWIFALPFARDLRRLSGRCRSSRRSRSASRTSGSRTSGLVTARASSASTTTRKLFHDEVFWKRVAEHGVLRVVGVPLTIAIGLAAAVGLNHAALGSCKGIFRVGYYLPVVTSIVASP